jgi:hypothetical protein
VAQRDVDRPAELVEHLAAAMMPGPADEDDVCLLCFRRR